MSDVVINIHYIPVVYYSFQHIVYSESQIFIIGQLVVISYYKKLFFDIDSLVYLSIRRIALLKRLSVLKPTVKKKNNLDYICRDLCFYPFETP